MVQPFLPNEADAFNANQAEPDSVDFEILLLGHQRTGVISGCVVSEDPSTPDMTVDVTAGEVVETGEQITVSAQLNNVVSAADGTNPRIDLVTVNGSGTVVVTAGTAAAEPVAPAIPATSVPLAFLYVPTSDTSIADNQINDKRVFVGDRYVFNVKDFGAVGDGSTDDTTALVAAFAAAQGNELIIPSGDYLCSQQLTLSTENTRITGLGDVEIHFTAATNGIEITVGNSTIRNVLLRAAHTGCLTAVLATVAHLCILENVEVFRQAST